MMSIYSKLLSLTLLLALIGCGGKDSKDGKSGGASKGDEPSWAPFSADAPLVVFDDTTADQTVDNGRMTLKLITDWKEKNEKRGNLFVFLKGGKSYPTLIVQKPEDAPADIKDLDDTSKTAFLADVTTKINDKYKGYILDKPKLIDINGRPWVFYRVKMASSTEKLEVPFLTTIANGRKYTLEMRAIEKKGNHDWPALLTMANGMAFAGDKKTAEPMPMAESQSSDAEKAEMAKNAIVGEWTSEPVANDPFDDYVFEIKADGTFRHWIKKKGADRPEDLMKGTWKKKGDKLIEIDAKDANVGTAVKFKAELLDPNTIDLQFVETDNSGGDGPGKLKRR